MVFFNKFLDEIAARIDAPQQELIPAAEGDDQLLKQVLAACDGCEQREMSAHLRSLVTLLGRIDGVTRSLAEDISA